MIENITDQSVEQRIAFPEIKIAELKISEQLSIKELAEKLSFYYSKKCSRENDKLSQDKLDWLKEIEVKVFEHPAKYCVHNWVFSEEYLRRTPLEELKRRYMSVDLGGSDYESEV